MSNELGHVIKELGDGFDDFKKRYAEKHADLARQLDQIDAIVSRRPLKPADGTSFVTAEQREHADVIAKWLRNPRNH